MHYHMILTVQGLNKYKPYKRTTGHGGNKEMTLTLHSELNHKHHIIHAGLITPSGHCGMYIKVDLYIN